MSVHGMTDQFGAMRVGDAPYQGDPYGGYGNQGSNQGGTPATQYSAGPPQPSYQPPSDKPPLPQGWTPLFDQQYQRWYYVAASTGKSQWEAPGPYAPPPPPVNSPPTQYQDGYGPPAGPPAGGAYASYDQGYSRENGSKKGSGAGGMMLGAAGGLAAGAIGGAVLHHVLHDSDSDDDRPEHVTNQYINYGAPPVVYENRSDSDRESLDEAREDLDEARDNYRETLNDSSASSSDVEEAREELEEADREYEEENDDYYDDD